MLLSEGQMSHYKGAALMLDALPPAKTLLGDTEATMPAGSAMLLLNAASSPASRQNQPQNIDPSRPDALPPAPQDREHVRQAQGLATHPYPLRPLLSHLFLSHLYRSHRHLLDQTMSPDA